MDTPQRVLGCLFLLPAAQNALIAQEHEAGPPGQGIPPSWHMTPLVLVGLTPALLLSDASLICFYLGQFGIFETFGPRGSTARPGRRAAPSWAWGLASCAGHRQGDDDDPLPDSLSPQERPAYLGGASRHLLPGLCLAGDGQPPGRPPARLLTYPERLRELEAPEKVNDYSF